MVFSLPANLTRESRSIRRVTVYSTTRQARNNLNSLVFLVVPEIRRITKATSKQRKLRTGRNTRFTNAYCVGEYTQ